MKLVFLAGVAALALGACDGGSGNQSAPVAAGQTAAIKAAPAGTNYTEQFSQTPEGGMLMGNPNARVKLVEYLSLTCPHCAQFSQESSEAMRRYVASGDVSYEVRNFVLNGLDASAVLLARCSGPGPFFGMLDQLYATQGEWIERTQANQAQIANAPQNGIMAAYASASGLDQFVRMRGVPEARARQCLSDQSALQRIEANNKRASELGVTGTPSFFINGDMADDPNGDGVTWTELEPQIRSAIG